MDSSIDMSNSRVYLEGRTHCSIREDFLIALIALYVCHSYSDNIFQHRLQVRRISGFERNYCTPFFCDQMVVEAVQESGKS